MTVKDAVKCRKLGLENAWFLAVEALLPAEWEAALLNEVKRCLKKAGGRR